MKYLDSISIIIFVVFFLLSFAFYIVDKAVVKDSNGQYIEKVVKELSLK